MYDALTQREIIRGTNIFNSDHVDVAYGSPAHRRSIATFGLGGCSGLIVSFDSPRAVVLGHFQPWRMLDNYHKEPLLKLLSEVSSKAKVVGALLLHQGELDETAITGVKEWSSPSNNTRIAGLTELVLEGVASEVPVISAGYYAVGRGGSVGIEQGSVIVDLYNDIDEPRTRVGGVEVHLDQLMQHN